MLKFVLINGREWNRKLPKVFASKNLQMTQKASRTDLIKESLKRCVIMLMRPHHGLIVDIETFEAKSCHWLITKIYWEDGWEYNKKAKKKKNLESKNWKFKLQTIILYVLCNEKKTNLRKIKN